MGALELCSTWDIYGQDRNLFEDYGSRNSFLVIDKFQKISCVTHVTFLARIMSRTQNYF